MARRTKGKNRSIDRRVVRSKEKAQVRRLKGDAVSRDSMVGQVVRRGWGSCIVK